MKLKPEGKYLVIKFWLLFFNCITAHRATPERQPDRLLALRFEGIKSIFRPGLEPDLLTVIDSDRRDAL